MMDEMMMRKKALGGVRDMAGRAMGERLIKKPAPAVVTVSVEESPAEEAPEDEDVMGLMQEYEAESAGG